MLFAGVLTAPRGSRYKAREKRREGREVEKREGKTEKDSKLEWYRMKTENSCIDVGRRGVNRQRCAQMGRKRV